MRKLYMLLSLFVAFSCVKDAKHLLSEDDYDFVLLTPEISVSNTGMTFQGFFKKQNEVEVIDHGFVWGAPRTDISWNFTEYHFERWINESGDSALRSFLIGMGTRISLGRIDESQTFRYEQCSDVAPGKNYLMMAYIATKDYTLYTKVIHAKGSGSSSPVIERVELARFTQNEVVIYGKNFCSNVRDAKIENWPYHSHIYNVSLNTVELYLFGTSAGTNTFTLTIFDKSVPVTLEIF